NWQLSGTTSLVSGQAKNLTVSYSGTNGAIAVPAGQSCPSGFQRSSPTQCSIITDLTGGEVNARMVMVCDPNRRAQKAPDGTPVYIDISCLRLPQRGEIGNTPRNSLRRPGVILTDLALFKNFRLRERMNLQFRWETYNLFNHTNFGDIDAAATFSVAGG